MKMRMFTMLLAALAAGTGLAAETFAFHGRLSKADVRRSRIRCR